MKPLVAVDWGTSSLRVARIASDGAVLEERSSPRGILTVAAGQFPSVLHESCGDWLQQSSLCLVSGMAGSRQGWQEAPYCPCPAGFAELARSITWIEPQRVALVPGLCCEQQGIPDVMRGEEVQVFGAMQLLGLHSGVFVLPGTHSKWVHVEHGRVQRFATFMAGELYALLRQHSILARMLPAEDGSLDQAAFTRGVLHARDAGSLLRTAFSVRTLALFDRMPAAALASYLSGLVIGEELRAQGAQAQDVVLVGSDALTQRYALALRTQRHTCRSVGHAATWRGLWTLAQNLE
jgi:2-dehydro-3-deoxygalactonokinase